MTSAEQVLAAFAFKAPDRIPRFDNFWSYPEEWENRFGTIEELSDISIWCPDEGAFPIRKKHIKEDDIWAYNTDSWGRTSRGHKDAYFVETLEVPIPPGTDPDKVKFDPPDMASRYRIHGSESETSKELKKNKKRYCVFGKTGGPYLRTTFVRGETQFLIDIASDPGLARAPADKMADHLIAIAKEEIRRWDLCCTGVWIYDDPRLILTGGMCNTRTLPFGTPDEIEREAKELIDMGRNGGVVIGTHSISPEVPLDSFAVYHNTCLSYGIYT